MDSFLSNVCSVSSSTHGDITIEVIYIALYFVNKVFSASFVPLIINDTKDTIIPQHNQGQWPQSQ